MRKFLSPAALITALLLLGTTHLIGSWVSCGMSADPYVSRCTSSVGRDLFPNSLSLFFTELGLFGWPRVPVLLLLNGIFLLALWPVSRLREPSMSRSIAAVLIYVLVSLVVLYGIIAVKLNP